MHGAIVKAVKATEPERKGLPVIEGVIGLLSGEQRRAEVLFVCVHNAGRSQMAAGLTRLRSQGRIRVRSAGLRAGRRDQPERRRSARGARHRHDGRVPQAADR